MDISNKRKHENSTIVKRDVLFPFLKQSIRKQSPFYQKTQNNKYINVKK